MTVMTGKTRERAKKAAVKKSSKAASATKKKPIKASPASTVVTNKKTASKKSATSQEQPAKKKVKTNKPSTKKASKTKKSTTTKKAATPSNPIQNTAAGVTIINGLLGIAEHLHHLAPFLQHILHSVGLMFASNYQKQLKDIRGKNDIAGQQRARILLDASRRTSQLAKLAELLRRDEAFIQTHASDQDAIAKQIALKLMQITTASGDAQVEAAYERWHLDTATPQADKVDRPNRII